MVLKWYPRVTDIFGPDRTTGMLVRKTFSYLYLGILAFALGRSIDLIDWPLEGPNAHPFLGPIMLQTFYELNYRGIKAVNVYGPVSGWNGDCYVSADVQNNLLGFNIISSNMLAWYGLKMADWAEAWVLNGSVGNIDWGAFEANLSSLPDYNAYLGLLNMNQQRTLLIQLLRACQANNHPNANSAINPLPVPLGTSNPTASGSYIPLPALLSAVDHHAARRVVRQIQGRQRRTETRNPPVNSSVPRQPTAVLPVFPISNPCPQSAAVPVNLPAIPSVCMQLSAIPSIPNPVPPSVPDCSDSAVANSVPNSAPTNVNLDNSALPSVPGIGDVHLSPSFNSPRSLIHSHLPRFLIRPVLLFTLIRPRIQSAIVYRLCNKKR